MTRRTAYATFEKTILDLYERGHLTLHLLDQIASQYRLIGPDSAGSQYVCTQDGKDLHQICIELVDPTFAICARGSHEDHEEYWEQELKKWEEIVHGRWGWHAYSIVFLTQNQGSEAA
ncbi:MAG: hypothetical protein ABI234_07155 [Ktedonobacteraceae bacterium]